MTGEMAATHGYVEMTRGQLLKDRTNVVGDPDMLVKEAVDFSLIVFASAQTVLEQAGSLRLSSIPMMDAELAISLVASGMEF
ncbi:hypothetical protein [Accumulibacter sp.]|uniref:hypothetical protein n=1 Tax=Accumulibacter sp. TaxID=2053492 RepID=UPI0025F19DCF|nr:hypothetical protein [Accumulibacter sp.]MCP5228556.1 hypothetical protein [Accumulibacter sp.]